jgi:hypothetical protein
MASNTHGGRRSQIANYILITAAVLLLTPSKTFLSADC